MRYSEDIIEEVRQKNDIVAVIGQYVKLSRAGSSYQGLCPFHSEKSPSFTVSSQKQLYHCFGCGAGGNVFNFIMQYENVTFGEALKELAERANVTLPKIEYSGRDQEKIKKKNQLLEINRAAARFYYACLRQEVGAEGLRYLTQRGLSMETIKSFGLGYSDPGGIGLYRYLKGKGYSDELLLESALFSMDSRRGSLVDKFRGRVMFPIMDVNSRVIGFGGRVMGDGKPKYLNSQETLVFEKRRNLYGLHAARKTRTDTLILCEGYMDVIAMHQAGFTNAVASLGTALTGGHANLMKHYASKVLLIYDSDTAGIRATQRAVPILREAGLSSRVVDLSPHKDPDEFIKAEGAQAFQKALDASTDSFMHLVKIEAGGRNLEEPQGRNQFYDACALLLYQIEDTLERNLYADAIMKEYGRSEEKAQDLLGRVRTLAMKGKVVVTPAPAQESTPAPKGGRKQKENATELSQKLILTWVVNYPGLARMTMEYLKPEDFTVDLYREVAQMLYEQVQAGDVNIGRLLNSFMDSQEHTEVAAGFTARIHLDNEEQVAVAYTDALLNIRDASLAKQKEQPDKDIMEFFKRSKEQDQLKAKRQDLIRRCQEAIHS